MISTDDSASALEADPRLYRVLVEETRELLCLHEVDARFSYLSPSISQLLGYSPADLVGTHPFELVHPEDRPEAEAALESVLRGGETPVLTSRFRTSEGGYRWIEVQTRALRSGGDEVTHLVTSSRDVTQRMELLGSVSEREATLRTVIASFDDLVFVFDPEGRFVEYFQPAHRVDLHAPPESFLGRSFQEVLPDHVAEPLGDALRRARAEEAVQEFEYELMVGGEQRHYQARLSPLILHEGAGGGYVGVVRDVTLHRLAEEERLELVETRERARRLQGLAILARGTSHEFNNLLTAIQGNLALAMEDLEDGHAAGETMSQALESARRASEVARRLLAFSGEARGRRESVDPVELVGKILRGQKERPDGIRMQFSIEGEPDPVSGDPEMLGSALDQLVRNAIEAHPDGEGLVEVSVCSREVSAEELAESRLPPPPLPGRFTLIRIVDSGEGIPAEDLERMFEPFFTTRFLGRGLGLAEVAGVLRSHDGAILVQSEPAVGTRVDVLIPSVAQPASPASRAE
ncbi:MAG: PAS domain-containing protein [Gemmatimonadota bacterium]